MKNEVIEVFENARSMALKQAIKFLVNAKENKIFNGNKYINMLGINSSVEAIFTANRSLRKVRRLYNEI